MFYSVLYLLNAMRRGSKPTMNAGHGCTAVEPAGAVSQHANPSNVRGHHVSVTSHHLP